MTAPKRRLRFGLRTLFVVVTTTAILTLGARWLLRDVKSEVEAMAISYSMSRKGLRKDQIRAEAFPEGDVWTVYLYYVPATPDAMWTLEVSTSGKVTER